MVNELAEERVPLDGDGDRVLAFLEDLSPELVRPRPRLLPPEGQALNMVSPDGVLVRVLETHEGYELRVLADPALAARLAQAADAFFGIGEMAA